MNNRKIKHLPINFLFCISSFLSPFFLISSFTEINIYLATVISFYIYLTEVKQSCENDYLDERIKYLEEKIKDLINKE